jgi:hypothetical protein
LEPESRKVDGKGIEKMSDSVEVVHEREPGFKIESIPPDDPAAAEALAATRTMSRMGQGFSRSYGGARHCNDTGGCYRVGNRL